MGRSRGRPSKSRGTNFCLTPPPPLPWGADKKESMREIKFRSWHNVGQKMIYDDFPGDSLRWRHKENQPVDVMQFTGLKDRTGKEIYEGDILDGHSDGLVKIEWANENGSWECIFKDEANIGIAEMCTWFGNKAIVVGNIYEHLSLLTTSTSH